MKNLGESHLKITINMKEVFTSTTKQDLDDNINEFIENHDVIDWPFVTIVTEIVKDETPAGYHWKGTLVPKDTVSAMKDLLCEEHEFIRHFWCKDDIRGLETGGRAFTEEEVELIAQKVESQVDCCYGINWDFIDDIAQDVAPGAYREFVEDDGNDIEFRHIEKQYTPDEQ